MRLVELPPRLCLSKQVSLLSRYGIYMSFTSYPLFCLTVFSVKAVITFLSVKRLLLISIDSFCATPSVFTKLWRSEPAKSTIYSLLMIVLSGLLANVCSTVMQKIVCEREEVMFILWLPIVLFYKP